MVAPLALFALGALGAGAMEYGNRKSAKAAEEDRAKALQRAVEYSGILGQPRAPGIMGGAARPGPTMNAWQGLPRTQQENSVLRYLDQAGYRDEVVKMIQGRMAPQQDEFVTINGQLVNKRTGKVKGDYRTPEAAPEPDWTDLYDIKTGTTRKYDLRSAAVRQRIDRGELLSEAPENSTLNPADEYTRATGAAVPSDMMPVRDPSQPSGWTLQPQTGGPLDPTRIEQERKQEILAQKPDAEEALATTMSFYDKQLAAVNRLLKNPELKNVVGSMEGSDSWLVPGGSTFLDKEESNAVADITELQDMLSVEGLSVLKDMTGGAGIGPITEQEWPKMQAIVSSLQRTRSDEDFIRRLLDLKKNLMLSRDRVNKGFREKFGDETVISWEDL